MTRRHLFTAAIGGALWIASGALSVAAVQGAAAQGTAAPAPATTLKIGGDVKTPLSLMPDELKSMPRTQVEVKDEDGRVVQYEGVLVAELLKKAGAPLGSELRGNAMATYVAAVATDGYQVVFSLAELDPVMTSNQIIIADTIDGKPLFAYQGPLRIVAPKDSRPARSLRMLERLDVVRLKK